jgi:drug/metabolite transporter (DMT)-like permease
VIQVMNTVSPTALALAAVLLWSLLAMVAVRLADVPPFLLLALSLGSAGVLALPTWRSWLVAPTTILLGIYGLFGFHLLLFLALRWAPAVEANLVNYLWPLLIVALAPVVVPGVRLGLRHVAAVSLGLVGAALLITGGRWSLTVEFWTGYLLAAGSAFVWATYSLLTRRVAPFPTAAVGLFCLLSGALAFGCHLVLEPAYVPSLVQAAWIALLAIGPMGAAFFLWDAALKRGDPRTIGALAYLTPLGSTLWLVATGSGSLTPVSAVAALLIVGGAAVGAAGR